MFHHKSSKGWFSLATESSRSRNQNVKLIRSSETVSVDSAYDTMVYDSVSVSFFICQKKMHIHTDIPCRVSFLYNGRCRDLGPSVPISESPEQRDRSLFQSNVCNLFLPGI